MQRIQSLSQQISSGQPPRKEYKYTVNGSNILSPEQR
jgi:hypothetical protein